MYTDDDETGCWHWNNTPTDSYGSVHRNGRTQRAHRYVWMQLRRPIPDGLHIDHLCRVKNCVNPDHLETVTPGENIRRGNRHKR